jgi:hypothetical protein
VGAASGPVTRGGGDQRRLPLALITLIGLVLDGGLVLYRARVDLPTQGGQPVPPGVHRLRARPQLGAHRGHDLGQPLGLGHVLIGRVILAADRVERRDGLALQIAQPVVIELPDPLRGQFDALLEHEEPHRDEIARHARCATGEGRTLHGGISSLGADVRPALSQRSPKGAG